LARFFKPFLRLVREVQSAVLAAARSEPSVMLAGRYLKMARPPGLDALAYLVGVVA